MFYVHVHKTRTQSRVFRALCSVLGVGVTVPYRTHSTDYTMLKVLRPKLHTPQSTVVSAQWRWLKSSVLQGQAPVDALPQMRHDG